MSKIEQERSSIAWPSWMLRYIASGDQEAFWDLVWSVGGSPPYGGVSYEEAQSVYDLLEDYRGPGVASRSSYEAVKGFIRGEPYRLAVLEIFSRNDQITSNPDSYIETPVTEGLALSLELNHEGVRALFLSYRADLSYRFGALNSAREDALEALKLFLDLADRDAVYAYRARQLASNAVAFTQMSGDEDEARRLHRLLEPILADLDS